MAITRPMGAHQILSPCPDCTAAATAADGRGCGQTSRCLAAMCLLGVQSISGAANLRRARHSPAAADLSRSLHPDRQIEAVPAASATSTAPYLPPPHLSLSLSLVGSAQDDAIGIRKMEKKIACIWFHDAQEGHWHWNQTRTRTALII